MHNLRRQMAQAVLFLNKCLKSNDLNYIKSHLDEILNLENKRPGALPGKSLQKIKDAIKILNKSGDIKKAKELIQSAKAVISKDKYMQKRMQKYAS